MRSEGRRVMVAAGVALYAIAWVLWDYWRDPGSRTDFDEIYYAAQAVRHGLNPYVAIGPAGLWHPTEWPLFYPMPAVVLAIPLSFLPLLAARMVVVGFSSALLAYGVTRFGWVTLLIFVSGAFVEAARVAQWSILFAASLVLPMVAVAFPAKPTLGLICGSAVKWPTARRAVTVLVCAWAALLLLSWALAPSWVSSWLDVIRQYPQYRPLLASPLGIPLLAALVRWRRPEARLLVAYALVPHLNIAYEALPVMLAARSRLQYLMLATGSVVAYAVQSILIYPTDPTMRDPRLGTVMLLSVYLPALVMVLRRPNVGLAIRWPFHRRVVA